MEIICDSIWHTCIGTFIATSLLLEEKTFKNVKKRFWVALESMETRKSQLYPPYWMNVAKSYGDLFYNPISLPGCFLAKICLQLEKSVF